MCELGELVKPLENVIRFIFIPSITGRHICSDNEHKLLSLPTRHGDLAVPLYHEIVSFEYEKFMKLIFLPNLIKDQSKVYHVDEIDQRKMNSDIRSEREHCHKNTLNELRDNMSYSQMRLKIISQQIGVSNWPTSYPFSEHGFDLNEQQLQDGIRIRYRWELINIPSM